MSLLRVENLGLAAAGRVLLEDVSFTVEAGEVLALVGESGAGKTLCARSLLRLLPAGVAQTGGRVVLDAVDVGAASPRALRRLRGGVAGMVFQEPFLSLDPLRRVGVQLAEALALHGKPAARVAALFQEAGLGDAAGMARAFPHELSGGQLQRVMMAVALAGDPKLLVADEPASALDAMQAGLILALIGAARVRRGLGLLLITHDVALVRRQASRVVVLQAGRVVEMGSVSEVLARPRAAATRRLLEAALPAPPPAVAGAEILRVEGLSVGRGRAAAPVVRDVSLALRAGETLGIAGESGAGKTSLGLAVLKLLPARGRVMFEGRDLAGLSGAEMRRARRFMQIVFQDPAASLAPRMLVEDIVAEALLAHEPGLGRAARRVRVATALEEVGLGAEVAERFAHECSGGQRQRVALARALILRPRLLVLDEPASALDAVARAAFCALLRRLQARTGMGFLLISHDLAVLRALAHRIIVLRNGAVVEEGAAADIFERPRADYTKCLMAAARVEAPSVVDG